MRLKLLEPPEPLASLASLAPFHWPLQAAGKVALKSPGHCEREMEAGPPDAPVAWKPQLPLTVVERLAGTMKAMATYWPAWAV